MNLETIQIAKIKVRASTEEINDKQKRKWLGSFSYIEKVTGEVFDVPFEFRAKVEIDLKLGEAFYKVAVYPMTNGNTYYEVLGLFDVSELAKPPKEEKNK